MGSRCRPAAPAKDGAEGADDYYNEEDYYGDYNTEYYGEEYYAEEDAEDPENEKKVAK